MADITTNAAGEAEVIPPRSSRGAPPRVRRRRWPIVLMSVAALLVAATLVLSRWNVDYYALSPGDASPVTSFIKVPSKLDHPLSGKILLTDVFVTPLTVLTYLQERYLSSDSQVVPSVELLGPSTPADQLAPQGFLEMSQAQSQAKAAALTYLGYAPKERDAGALVFGIAPGSPASHVLKVSQVITAVNGTSVTGVCSLVSALHGLLPGATATLSVEQSSVKESGAFVNGPTVQRPITLGAPPKGLTDGGCGLGKPTAYLGIQPNTQQSWSFPVNVSVNTVDIGGPSAGLSMTLGIIDKLSGGHLTAGRTIAATGTIEASGAVGDVGGVPQKTIAVERAGATVFFVPPQEYKAALSKDTPQLHVYAVSTLDQALAILKRLGGTLPASHLPSQAAP
jgi:PDZ domain-containing protein